MRLGERPASIRAGVARGCCAASTARPRPGRGGRWRSAATGPASRPCCNSAAGVLRPVRGRVVDRPPPRSAGCPSGSPPTSPSRSTRLSDRHGAGSPAWAEAVPTGPSTEWTDRLRPAPRSAGVRLPDLSKGTAQKVGLAQAMLRTPGLLVLDEPWEGRDFAAGLVPEFVDEVLARRGSGPGQRPPGRDGPAPRRPALDGGRRTGHRGGDHRRSRRRRGRGRRAGRAGGRHRRPVARRRPPRPAGTRTHRPARVGGCAALTRAALTRAALTRAARTGGCAALTSAALGWRAGG